MPVLVACFVTHNKRSSTLYTLDQILLSRSRGTWLHLEIDRHVKCLINQEISDSFTYRLGLLNLKNILT